MKRPTAFEYRYIKSLDELRDGEIFVSLEGTYHGHFAIGWAKRPVEDASNFPQIKRRVKRA